MWRTAGGRESGRAREAVEKLLRVFGENAQQGVARDKAAENFLQHLHQFLLAFKARAARIATRRGTGVANGDSLGRLLENKTNQFLLAFKTRALNARALNLYILKEVLKEIRAPDQ